MISKTRVYRAVLVGTHSARRHVESLQSNPLFELLLTENVDVLSVEVKGPKRDHPRPSLDELRSSISGRAEALGVDAPDKVDETIGDIHAATLAEGIVLIGRMDVTFPPCANRAQAEVVLRVIEEGGSAVAECLDFYAAWRISCAAQAMEMAIEGEVENITE